MATAMPGTSKVLRVRLTREYIVFSGNCALAEMIIEQIKNSSVHFFMFDKLSNKINLKNYCEKSDF